MSTTTVAIVETSVLHHHADGVGVPNVIERVGVEDDEIGVLVGFNRSELGAASNGARAE